MSTGADAETEPVGRERTTLKTVLVLVALICIGFARWWFGSPDGSSMGFSATQSDISYDCDVSHEGFPYPARHESFVVAPGDRFEHRFGPFDVRAEFLDETERHGLEVEVGSRDILNSGTVGSSIGGKNREFQVTTGPGLGTLTIDCKRPGASQ